MRIVSRKLGFACLLAAISTIASNSFVAAQEAAPGLVDQAFFALGETAGNFDITDKIDVRKAEMVVTQNIALAQHTHVIEAATKSAIEALKVFEQLENLAKSEAQISSFLREVISEAKLATARLHNAGITRDMLAAFVIELLSNKLISSDLDKKQILDVSVQINENFSKLTTPQHILEALYNRARPEKKLGKDVRLFEAVLRISNELIKIEAENLLVDVELRAQVDDIVEKSIEILKSEDPEKSLILAARIVETHSEPNVVHRFLYPFGKSFTTSAPFRSDYFEKYRNLDEAGLIDAFEEDIGSGVAGSVELVVNMVAGYEPDDPRWQRISLGLTEALARKNHLDMALFSSFWVSSVSSPAGVSRDAILNRISLVLSEQGRGFAALEAAGRIRSKKLRVLALVSAAQGLAEDGYTLAVETIADAILDSVFAEGEEFGAEADQVLADLSATLGQAHFERPLKRILTHAKDDKIVMGINRQLLRIAIDNRDAAALDMFLSGSLSLERPDQVWAKAFRSVLGKDAATAADLLYQIQQLAVDGDLSATSFGRFSAFGAYIHQPDFLRELLNRADPDLSPATRVSLMSGFVERAVNLDPQSVTELGFIDQLLTDMIDEESLEHASHLLMLETLALLGNVELTDLLINMIDGQLDADQVLVRQATALAMAGRFEGAKRLTAQMSAQDQAVETLTNVLRFEARLGSLEDGARQLRLVDDYKLRTAAYRDIAEWSARTLDRDGLLSKNHPPAFTLTQKPQVAGTGNDPALVDMEATSFDLDEQNTLRADAGVKLIRQNSFIAESGYPGLIAGLDASVDDVRELVPLLPRAGPSGLSVAGLNRFARLNRFSSKFFEEVVGMSARDYLYKRQGTINPIFLYLTEGVFTVEKLLHLSVSGRFRTVDRVEDGFIIRAPIVVGPDATLVLSGQEAKAFYLSQSYGSFIVNAGKLFVVDTTLGAYDERKKDFAFSDHKSRKNFRPFILSWSNSETYVGGSRIVGLGYSAGKSYGLSLSSGPKDSIGEKRNDRRPFGIIADNSFDNMLYGFYSYEADDVAVVGNEYRDNITYGLDPHDRSRRLTLSYNTGYGTLKKHGGIISREVDDSFLIGNLMFDNAGSGLMVDRDSMATTVYANTAFGNEQDGLTYFESPCALIDSNHFFNNRRAGIKARNSWDLTISRNLIEGNAEAAIDGYISILEDTDAAKTRDFQMDPYFPFGSFFAAENQLRDNDVGIKANGLSAVTLGDNTFIHQRSALYGGDLKEQSLWLLKHTSDGHAVSVTSSCLPRVSHHKECALHSKGLIATHITAPEFSASPVHDFCLSDKSSIQAGAVSPVTN